MDQRKSSSQSGLFVIVIIVIVLMVAAMLSISNKVRELSPAHDEATPVVTVASNMPSPLTVTVRVISTQCLDTEKIDYSVVELSVSGGKAPYELITTNSDLEQSGPYLILTDNLPIRIKVYGGDQFTAVVRSDAGEIWSGNIGLPTEAEICKVSTAPALELTATEPVIELSETPELPNTETVTASPTSTPTAVAGKATPTSTRKPHPTPTNTPAFLQPTATPTPKTPGAPDPEPTDTPRPQATDTPRPQATDTPRPQPTDTPRPQPTDTPRPQPTDTPHSQSTIAPTPINPHPHQCEDGKDNDGDGKTDLADPDCKKSSDPKE